MVTILRFVKSVWMRVLFVSILMLQGRWAGAQSNNVIRIPDEQGDDYGAGAVKYPEDKLFVPGCLDVTEFRVLPFSGGVQFEIDFATRVPRPPEDRKVSRATYLRELQNNGLFLQNVDIYIDED